MISFTPLIGNLQFLVVFVLGGPGSGKGTNCSRIVDLFGYVHLCAGDLLRAEMSSGSNLAEQIKGYFSEGKIVPSEITVDLLKRAMERESAYGADKFLIDGFPRDLPNLRCWESSMSNLVEVQFLLFLDCPMQIMFQRLIERGRELGRKDDTEESIRKRFKTYDESTRPLIDYFRSQGKIRTVDTNRDCEQVFDEVCLHFRSAAHRSN